ncbi:hypothetical protein GPECTOR_14g253 [Gonium pectorale]|uniref:RING-CH-type domain-containing protein n=1 Tax=Gonium pectorale TaxID=33097 RepID=A0A150GMQ5_GONPE|nr:hypothetical protein GPECTOR_14g253 [Gonium pectorale]|eukprot:KXZ51012.1 hypothetical protein GPECTOR_14g253 [Gonium pectorale]
MLEEEGIIQADNPRQAPADMETDDMCWICLDDTKDKDPLINPCKCPRKVHPRCLARWQLQQAGRLEETNCRFCQCNLADWKTSLTPENLKPEVQRVQPIMVVYFEGQIHRIPVKQGPDGLKEFTLRIRELFRLPEDVDISLTFGCKEPLSGQHLKLEGIGAFDAAVHCASVAAAERQQKLKSGGGAASVGGAAPAGGECAAAGTAAADGDVGGGDAGGLSRTHTAPPQPHAHHVHHRYLHQHAYPPQHGGEGGGAFGMAPDAAVSAPASAQGSDGGADSGTPSSLLQPAASAPTLAHYTSSTSDSSSSRGQQQQQHPQRGASGPAAVASPSPERSFPGCGSLSDEPASTAHSARTSSGGGATADSAPLHASGQAVHGSSRRAGAMGSGYYAAANGGVGGSPFESAAYGGLAGFGASEGAGHYGMGPLRSQVTVPAAVGMRGTAGASSEPPLAATISEPTAGRLAPPTPGNANGISYASLSNLQHSQSHQQLYGPGMPYAMPYVPPQSSALPPLSPRGGAGGVRGAVLRQPSPPQVQTPADGSRRPSQPDGEGPHAPRDHYTPERLGRPACKHQQQHNQYCQPSPGPAPQQPAPAGGSGPTTPVRPIPRRPAGTPTSPPPGPLTLGLCTAAAAASGRHHPYSPEDDAARAAAAAALWPVRAGMSAATPSTAETGGAAANRRPRPVLATSPRSEYGSAMPSPAADAHTVLGGNTFSNRIKSSLRVVKRAVRSLGLGSRGSGSVGGASCASPRLGAEAETESEAGAEAEVGTAGGRGSADCGAVSHVHSGASAMTAVTGY